LTDEQISKLKTKVFWNGIIESAEISDYTQIILGIVTILGIPVSVVGIYCGYQNRKRISDAISRSSKSSKSGRFQAKAEKEKYQSTKRQLSRLN
jgi:hypothetical protein